jgi:hypothetical protein
MDTLKEILKLYQKYFDRAEFCQEQDKYESATSLYDKAILQLYNAKEYCQHSDILQETANTNIEFENWLKNKEKSIDKQLDFVLKCKKKLQSISSYVKQQQQNNPICDVHINKVSQVSQRNRNEGGGYESIEESQQTQLSNRAIKFLCHLRGKFDFGNKEDKEFHEILNYQRSLMK